MLFGGKVESILKSKTEQDAIMAIDNLLTPVFYKKPKSLTQSERNIVYIEEMEREVNNRGLDQFFVNSSGDYAEETVEALKLIKSIRFLKILETAIEQFPNAKPPKDRDERLEVMERIEDKAAPIWGALDDEFYRYDEDIYNLMIAYVRANVKEFR